VSISRESGVPTLCLAASVSRRMMLTVTICDQDVLRVTRASRA
jgi:hypothetical protein